MSVSLPARASAKWESISSKAFHVLFSGSRCSIFFSPLLSIISESSCQRRSWLNPNNVRISSFPLEPHILKYVQSASTGAFQLKLALIWISFSQTTSIMALFSTSISSPALSFLANQLAPPVWFNSSFLQGDVVNWYFTGLLFPRNIRHKSRTCDPKSTNTPPPAYFFNVNHVPGRGTPDFRNHPASIFSTFPIVPRSTSLYAICISCLHRLTNPGI